MVELIHRKALITIYLSSHLAQCHFPVLEPPVLMPITFGREVVDEGIFAQVSCIAIKGDEPLTIRWTFHGEQVSSNQGITTTQIGSRGSMLIIASVNHAHSGSYTCKASNNAGSGSQTAKLNVNGKLFRVT